MGGTKETEKLKSLALSKTNCAFLGLEVYGPKKFNAVAAKMSLPVHQLHQEDLQKNREEIKNLPPSELGSSQRVCLNNALFHHIVSVSF